MQTLKPRTKTLGNRLAVAPVTYGYTPTPRQTGRRWLRKREVWLRNNPLCCACESKDHVTLACIVDHVTPLWKGGADDPTNYQSLCQPHHDEKTAREAGERASLMISG